MMVKKRRQFLRYLGKSRLPSFSLKLAEIAIRMDGGVLQRADDLIRYSWRIVNGFGKDSAYEFRYAVFSEYCVNHFLPTDSYNYAQVVDTALRCVNSSGVRRKESLTNQCMYYMKTFHNHEHLIEDLFYSMCNDNKKLDDKYITPDVITVAQSMTKTKDFTSMPILADALEDAGFTDGILDTMREKSHWWCGASWALYELREKH